MAVKVNAEWISALFANGSTPMVTKRNAASMPIEMTCAAGGGPGFTVAYDSYLILHNGQQNHTLTLILKINLNPLLPAGVPRMLRMPILDGSQTVFLMRPWTNAEWTTFVANFKRECLKWNDKFWLIPPAGFTGLDVKQGGQTLRPNIYCHLYIDVINQASSAHTSINVVNLDRGDASTRLGLSEQDLKGGAFRSDASQYSNYDTNPSNTSTPDIHGGQTEVKNFSTVAHEIGHSLGLPHIGMTHKDPWCQLAVVLNQVSTTPSTLPALFNGGSNGNACYGHLALPERGANIMGGGTSFEESNAAPWAARMALHTSTKAADWSISRVKMPPAAV